MNDTTRIPIDDFDDFATCRVSGTSAGIRYQAAMEAIAQFTPVFPWEPTIGTVGLRGREPHRVFGGVPFPQPVPGGAIGESELPWRYMA